MSDDDARLLGHRDGVVTAMLVIRREIAARSEQLRMTPRHHVRKRAAMEDVLAMLRKMDGELDRRQRENRDAWRERQGIEIVSPHRPEIDAI